MAKLDVRVVVACALLLVGGAAHLYAASTVGLSGGGFFLGLFGLASIAAVYGAWKLKPEAWLASFIVYILLVLITLLMAFYIYLVLSLVVAIYMLAIHGAFGVKLMKGEGEEAVAQRPTVTQLGPEAAIELSKKLGIDVKTVKCPKCSSTEVVVAEDSSAVCGSCNYGILDVKTAARA